MKIRTGFVANSSSSSFIIERSKISANQLHMIVNHMNVAHKLKMKDVMEYAGDWDEWSVYVEDDFVEMFTTMDNFDMYRFLINIGVKKEDIKGER